MFQQTLDLLVAGFPRQDKCDHNFIGTAACAQCNLYCFAQYILRGVAACGGRTSMPRQDHETFGGLVPISLVVLLCTLVGVVDIGNGGRR